MYIPSSIQTRFKRKIANYQGLQVIRSNTLAQGWQTKLYTPRIKILGREILDNRKSGISYIKKVFGLSRTKSVHFFTNFGYPEFQRIGAVKLIFWHHIKRSVEKISMIEKRLKTFYIRALRINVGQGNLQSSRFWRGLPIHGQNARTNGKTARYMNIVRLPPNMRLKSNSPFIMVHKNISRVLSKKTQDKKQGVSEKGQYAKTYKSKKK